MASGTAERRPEVFWATCVVRGLKRVDHLFVLTMTAYNLTRMRSLGQIRPQAL